MKAALSTLYRIALLLSKPDKAPYQAVLIEAVIALFNNCCATSPSEADSLAPPVYIANVSYEALDLGPSVCPGSAVDLALLHIRHCLQRLRMRSATQTG